MCKYANKTLTMYVKRASVIIKKSDFYTIMYLKSNISSKFARL